MREAEIFHLGDLAKIVHQEAVAHDGEVFGPMLWGWWLVHGVTVEFILQNVDYLSMFFRNLFG